MVMIDKYKYIRVGKGAVMAFLKLLSQNVTEETDTNHKSPQI
jgi:hypothetical protein